MTAPLSSTPVLRAALIWSAVVAVVVLVVAVGVGALVAGGDGALSGGVGAAVGAIFPALTAVSILVANRFYGHPSWLQIFFGVVLGALLISSLIFIKQLFIPFAVAMVIFATIELASAMRGAGRELTLHWYEGVRHWFFEENRPEFDAGAAALAWERTVAFLREKLAG